MAWRDLQQDVLEEFADASRSYGDDVWHEQAEAARAYRSTSQKKSKLRRFSKRPLHLCAQEGCTNLRGFGVYCDACLAYRRQRIAQDRQERKQLGRCIQTGCMNTARLGGSYCESCILLRREQRRLREDKAAQSGKCCECDFDSKPGFRRCEAHLAARADKCRQARQQQRSHNDPRDSV